MQNFEWLKDEKGPKMIVEAAKLMGTQEFAGIRNNPQILGWADYIGGWVGGYYNRDSIPWCGLFVGYVAKKAGKPVSQKLLSARAWLGMRGWKQAQNGPQLGDVCVFWRRNPHGSAGHVGFYVGESRDSKFYYILGGNQSDAVSVAKFPRHRYLGAVNYYRYGSPHRRRIIIDDNGMAVSRDEQ